MLPVKYTAPAKQAVKDHQSGIEFILKAAAITGMVYLGYHTLKKLIAHDPNKDQQKSAISLLQQLNQNPATQQTISNLQLEAYANGLFQAMDGWGTDAAYIYNVFQRLKNNADFIALTAAYGIREVSSGAWNPEPNYKGPLTGALANELSPSELLNVNSILAKKNIQFRV